MNIKFAVTKKRMAAFLLTMILPFLGMISGVICLLLNVCINKAFLITFVLFPLIAVGLIALCIFSRMRPFLKGLFSAIVLLLFVVLYLGGILFGTYVTLNRYTNDDVAQRYASVIQYDGRMPSLDEIGKVFDDRDHSTVLYSIQQVEKKMKQDSSFAEVVKAIKTNINSKR